MNIPTKKKYRDKKIKSWEASNRFAKRGRKSGRGNAIGRRVTRIVHMVARRYFHYSPRERYMRRKAWQAIKKMRKQGKSIDWGHVEKVCENAAQVDRSRCPTWGW